jgi:hypothetical protein
MSETIRIAKAIDQRINIHEDPVLVLSESVPSVQFNNLQVSGAASVNPTFNISVPPGQGLSREVFMAFTVTFTITGTNLTQFEEFNAIALRAFPLNSCLTSCNVNLGTNGVSMNTSLYQPLFTQWNVDSAIANADFSSFPSAPDLYANYGTAIGAVSSPFDPATSNPNSQYCNSSRTSQISNITISGTSITITANIIEPIMVSPFTYTGIKNPKKALFNLSNVVVSLSFNNLPHMLSWVIPTTTPVPTITSVVGTFTSQQLYYDIISPFEDSLLNSVRPTSYNYTNTQIQSSGFTIGATATTASTSSNVLQFSYIPSHFAIWAMPPPNALNDSTNSYPDFQFSISGVSVNFAQRSNLIGTNAQQIQLYNLCKKNGSNTSYPQWAGLPIISTGNGNLGRYGGGCLILDVSSDLSLPKSSCVGMASQVNFQINLTITNNSQVNWSTAYPGSQCQLFVAAFTPGICTIEYGGVVNLEVGAGITKEMYDNAPPISSTTDMAVRTSSYSNGYAGGSWSSFWNTIQPYVDPIGQALSRKAVGAIETAGAGKMHRGKIRGLLKGHF